MEIKKFSIELKDGKSYAFEKDKCVINFKGDWLVVLGGFTFNEVVFAVHSREVHHVGSYVIPFTPGGFINVPPCAAEKPKRDDFEKLLEEDLKVSNFKKVYDEEWMKEMVNAARVIKVGCKNIKGGCEGKCIFNTSLGCVLGKGEVPELWDIEGAIMKNKK